MERKEEGVEIFQIGRPVQLAGYTIGMSYSLVNVSYM